ncbi:hypothetical protein [Limnobacter sp.]|uniref:hypothetical protein n=1 Tax=Limnobacter sp. TaxID=2003368 RepID=UPI0025C500B0|nr:hypothetical protein [Limnobacter sp.]
MYFSISEYKLRAMCSAIGLSAVLVACGGGGDGAAGGASAGGGGTTTPAASTVSGAVAVGAPVSGATITIKCENAATAITTTTTAAGAYTVEIPSDSFPCALQATGGNLPAGFSALHSFASSSNASTINITQLTDLALAAAVGGGIAAWFDSPVWASGNNLPAELESLRTLLVTQGYTIPSTWTSGSTAPLTLAFTPSTTPPADSIDRLLEDIQAGIENAGIDYDTARGNFEEDESFPMAMTEEPDTGGGGNTGGGNTGGGTGVAQESLGAAAIGEYNSNSTRDQFLAAVTGTWPVAIHKVPAGRESLYGQGMLTLSGTEQNWSMELKGADGTTIFNRTNQGALTTQLNPFIGQLFLNHGADIDEFLNVFIDPNGFIEGSAGGNSEIQFRNEVRAWGEVAPQIFESLAGTWTSPATVSSSGSPFGPFTTVTNTAAITSTGDVTLTGKTQLGSDVNTTLVWGALNDFLIPDPEDPGFIMHLDIRTDVGVSMGTFQIRFDDITTPTVRRMTGFITTSNGQQTFEMNAPSQQNTAPVEAVELR